MGTEKSDKAFLHRDRTGYAQAVIEVDGTDAVMIKVSGENTQITKKLDVCP